MPVRRFRRARLLTLLWRLPLWAWRRPRTLARVVEALLARPLPDRLNLAETAMGLAFALVEAGHFRKRPPALFHGAWATMPATAAWLLARLVGRPFSHGAHAYDIFRHGGDWLLDVKVREARFIHTTTGAARDVLKERGASDHRILLCRRGLSDFPAFKPLRSPREPLRLLSVGRLVPKKGYRRQLWIYETLARRGVAFEARIVGGGPLRAELQQAIEHAGLAGRVTLLGALGGSLTQEAFRWGDVFLFTGRIAPDGDRDGLPNVIPEAMAHGLPIVTTAVSGTTEAIEDGARGRVLPLDGPEDAGGWADTIERLACDDVLAEQWRAQARTWVLERFDARRNTRALADALRAAAVPTVRATGKVTGAGAGP
jgi:glycosyltransferase involved in cell wall biosynthesis